MEADLCWVSGEQCSGGGVGPMGRQGTGLVRGGELLFCFGGRLEGKGRAYCDDFWKRPLGEGELWQQIEHAKSGGGAWPCARHNHALVAVSETMLLLHGGATHGEKKGKHFEQVYLGDIWTFDIAAGTWTKHEESPSWPHRHCHALHKVNDGRLVLFGGFGDKDSYHNDVWLLELMQGSKWEFRNISPRPGSIAPRQRSQMSSCVNDGKLWIFGGYTWRSKEKGEEYFDDLWSFDLFELEWKSRDSSRGPSPRNRAAMVVIGETKKMLLINGNFYRNERGTDEWYQETWELSCNARWKLLQTAGPAPKQSHLAAVYHNGFVYAFAGEKSGTRYSTIHILRL